jgi:hypothetical protein
LVTAASVPPKAKKVPGTILEGEKHGELRKVRKKDSRGREVLPLVRGGCEIAIEDCGGKITVEGEGGGEK